MTTFKNQILYNFSLLFLLYQIFWFAIYISHYFLIIIIAIYHMITPIHPPVVSHHTHHFFSHLFILHLSADGLNSRLFFSLSLRSDMRLRLGWLRRRGETQCSVRPQPEEAQSWAESFHNLMASKCKCFFFFKLF